MSIHHKPLPQFRKFDPKDKRFSKSGVQKHNRIIRDNKALDAIAAAPKGRRVYDPDKQDFVWI